MDFLSTSMNISKIAFTWHVSNYVKTTIHKDKPFNCLAILASGENKYYFENSKSFIVQKNDIIFLPKHSSYKVVTPNPTECFAINFEVCSDDIFEPFVINLKNPSPVLESFKAADAAFTLKKTGYEVKCMSELYSIIYSIIKEREREYIPQSTWAKITPAVEYIHKNYASADMSVNYLTEICGISPAYFREIFRKYYGIPPIQYINNLRLARAKELIMSDLYTVSKIAELSGFGDESYFCRYFKRATGTTPSEYKKTLR